MQCSRYTNSIEYPYMKILHFSTSSVAPQIGHDKQWQLCVGYTWENRGREGQLHSWPERCQHLHLAGRQAGRQGCVPNLGFFTPPKCSLNDQVHIRLLSHFWVWAGYVGPHSVLDLIRKDSLPRRWREFQFTHVSSLAADQLSQEIKQLARAAAW